MWEFKRGNPENLEGKASIYVHNRALHAHKSDSNLAYPVFRVGSSALDLVLPGESFKEYSDFILEEREKMKRFSNEKIEDHFMGFARLFAIKDPKCLFEIPGDIIFAGNVPGVSIGNNILIGASFMYHTDYSYQLSQRITGERKQPKKTPKIEVRTFDESGLVARLNALTIELYGSRELGDSKKEDYIRAQLLQLSERTAFAPQVANILDAFNSNTPNKEKIIELEIRLAGYIHAEKYREAAQLKEELDLLTKI